MKRDVKVGLFVAAVVCGLAAVLLGGGLSARTPGPVPALRLGGEAPDARAGAPEEGRSASVPADLTGGIEPPAEEAAPASAAGLAEPGEESFDIGGPAVETSEAARAAGG